MLYLQKQYLYKLELVNWNRNWAKELEFELELKFFFENELEFELELKFFLENELEFELELKYL